MTETTTTDPGPGSPKRSRVPLTVALVVVGVVAVAGAVVLYSFLTDVEVSEPASSPTPTPSPTDDGDVRSQDVSQTVTESDVTFAVSAVQCGYENVIASGEQIAAFGQFCTADLEIENGTESDLTLNAACQFAIVGGEPVPANVRATLAMPGSATAFDQGFPADGGGQEATLVFDLDVGAFPEALELHAACDSEGVRVEV